jgi:hypothetical protein
MYRGNNYQKASEAFKFRISPHGQVSEGYVQTSSIPPVQNTHTVPQTQMPKKSNTTITWSNKKPDMDIREPDVFGPALWFTLHNGSLRYPEDASPIVAEKMKGFILGFPYMVPCETCQSHAIAYVEKHYDELSEVCKGQKNLFKFFFDFHNYVNKRLGKPELSMEQALKLYAEDSQLKIMSYN